MIVLRPKLRSGVTAAVLLALGACSNPDPETPAAAVSPARVPDAAAEADVRQVFDTIPAASRPALRLARLKGLLLIAGRQDGGPQAARALLGQGLRDTVDRAPQPYRALGVDQALLRRAAGSGARADLQAAIDNVAACQRKAGGDDAAVVKGMVDIAAGLYQNAVQSTSVDPVVLQNALGAALAAQDLAAGSHDARVRVVAPQLDALVGLWRRPSAAEAPAPPSLVSAQASRIELELSRDAA